ncbi:phosphopantetheine adenylyltransferase [Panacagrimonas sp.]|uniref:phosphopantetheine adenylyltransferase n=1 Tax=Panacagrimonas sp. TaxID=2480088 RepID=UPI003B52F5B2
MNLAPSQWLLAGALLAVGIVHLVPMIGVLSAAYLHRLYGVSANSDATTVLLLRHRAVLFGLLGVLLCLAAFRPHWHFGGALVGLASMLSFVGLAAGPTPHAPPIRRVVQIDIGLSGLLLISLAATYLGAGA